MSAPGRPPHNRRFFLEFLSAEGNPSAPERRVLQAALDAITSSEQQAATGSVWLRAGRAQGRRLGMFDYHDRFEAADAWRLSTRFPYGGRQYSGLNGRGDAK
ncbi:MAG: hypothetical protein H0U16_11360 [Actinobacteria bacterium]|nr:hypothetical protein [Actinomycetota bacterium]